MIGTIILIITAVYSITMTRRHWDVLVSEKKTLMVEFGIEFLFLGFLVIVYGRLWMLKEAGIWESLVLFVAALLIFYEMYLAFKKARSIKERSMELLEALICVMEAGDPNLDGHSLHVHNIVNVFYDYLPPAYQNQLNLENLKYASLFIDMGKLGIPRSILTKAGKLTKEEMELMRRHPEICVKILSPVASFSSISDWILYHHERVDGKGYHGLKGGEIPLASRIIAIADTYSALTMDRTYKASLSYNEAITEIRQAAGTQLDEELVGYFCEIPMHRLDECFAYVRRIMERYQDEHFGE